MRARDAGGRACRPRRLRCTGRAASTGVVASGILLSGCLAGPGVLRAGRTRYNEAIRLTAGEQLLLNLVRLKYHDSPLFLDVGSIAAQFEVTQSAEAAGTLNENVGPLPLNPDVLSLGGRVAYAERPTLTLVPLQGEQFIQRLLTPIPLETIALLQGSGWSIERVLRLTVQRANGLDNATSASGPTPARAPPYERFKRLCRRLRELQAAGLIEMGFEPREAVVVGPIAVESVSVDDLVTAAGAGLTPRLSADGRELTLVRADRALVLRIAPEALDSPAVQEIVELLDLEPGRDSYEIVAGLPEQFGPAAERRRQQRIVIRTRSLLGVLFYLSTGVEVPSEHRRRGLVMLTRDGEGRPFDWSAVVGDLLRVRCRRAVPPDSRIAVWYRGCWFYVDESDLNSKATFALVLQLFDLLAGSAAAAAPVLTLPVGG